MKPLFRYLGYINLCLIDKKYIRLELDFANIYYKNIFISEIDLKR